jgi:hypothetical protein
MKHTLAVLLVAAAALSKSRVQANSCPAVPNPWYDKNLDNLGVGKLVTVDGDEFLEYQISGACLTALGESQTASGCLDAADNNEDEEDSGITGCEGGSQHTQGEWPVAFAWNDDTKTCTLYYEDGGVPSIDLRTELGDEAYGCNYDTWWFDAPSTLLHAVCEADQGEVELDVGVTGTTKLDNYNCDTTVDLDDTKAAIEQALEDLCNDEFSFGGSQCSNNCKVTITEIAVEGCDDRRRGLQGRRELQTTGTLSLEFLALAIFEINNSVDIHIAEQLADFVFEVMEDYFNDNLGDGDIADDIDDAVANTVFVAPGAVQGAYELSDIISKALGDFGNFYPAWHDSDSNSCVNDGKYPQYMENNSYFKPSLEECCKHYYSWDFTTCMLNGGADPFEYTNYEFYVDYESDSCKQSCPEDTEGLNCGGLHKNWQTTYKDAEQCCKDRLHWVHQEKCIAESEGGELDVSNLGSGDYYVDWQNFKCVKDCDEDSADPECGGLAKGWDQLYDSQNECCSSRLSWLPQGECKE